MHNDEKMSNTVWKFLGVMNILLFIMVMVSYTDTKTHLIVQFTMCTVWQLMNLQVNIVKIVGYEFNIKIHFIPMHPYSYIPI